MTILSSNQQPATSNQQPATSKFNSLIFSVLLLLCTLINSVFAATEPDWIQPERNQHYLYSASNVEASPDLASVMQSLCALYFRSTPSVTYECPTGITPFKFFMWNWVVTTNIQTAVMKISYYATNGTFSEIDVLAISIYKEFIVILDCPDPAYPTAIDFNGDKKIDICIGQKRQICLDNSVSVAQNKWGLKPDSLDSVGNPVSCSSGQKTAKEIIYSGAGNDPLNYNTYYSSPAYNETTGFLASAFDSANGKQRGDNQNRKIQLIYNQNEGQVYKITYKNGFSEIFYGRDPSLGGSIFFQSSAQIYSNLRVNSDGTFNQHAATGTVYNFNNLGQLTSRISTNGKTRTYTYTATGKLSTVTNYYGKQLQYFYNANDRLEKLIDPEGKEYRFEYDAQGNQNKIVYPDSTPLNSTDNPSITYLYENVNFPNNLTGKINEKGIRLATWNYDTSGRAISSEHAVGLEKVDLDYSIAGQTRVTRHVSNTLSSDVVYYYSTKYINGNYRKQLDKYEQIACTDCVVGSWLYEYDNEGYVNKSTSPKGVVSTFINGSNGLEMVRNEAVGTPEQREIRTGWNGLTRKPFTITQGNLKTDYTYDASGQLITTTLTDLTTNTTRTTTSAYGTAGILTAIDGFRTDVNDSTSFTYDLNGNLSTITNPLGHVITLENYDGSGRVGKITDANGVISTLTYTPRGWIKTSTINGASTQYDYFPTGTIKKVTTPNGLILNYEYDAGERLIAIVDSLGNRLEYVRDVMGNVTNTQIKDPANVLKSAQSSVFNALGQLSQNLGNNGQSNLVTYDAEGNPVSTKNALNNNSSTNYDALNRLIKSIDPNLGETTYSYNAHDDITSVTDAEGKVTLYEYNAFGDVTKLTSPDSGVTSYTYDSAGNVFTKTDARAITVTYTYDALNRLLTQSYPTTSENITYSYDDTTAGNKGIGRLTSVTDVTGSTHYFYNDFGQVTKETRIINGKTYITEYQFDSNGQLTTVIYPSGRTVSYSFDGVGRVSGLITTWQGASKTLASNINYLPFGPMTGLTYGNGKVLTQSYDLDYRLTAKSVTGINQLSYSYDVTNNITAINNSTNSALNQSYLYDKLSRLIHATGDYGVLGYSYDKIGNRLSKINNSQTDSYSYEASAHRLTSVTGVTTTNLSYDPVGNTLTKGNLTFTYNQQGRLQSASKTGMNASYAYNFKGERVSKTSNGQTTHFIYNGQGQLIAEADSTGTIQQEYLYLNGQRLATIANGAIYYLHTNQLDAPIALTDATGTIKWQAHYTPFGKALVDINNLTTTSQNQRFPGQYFDSETGMHYNYFRDYDAEIGRYLESDPIGLNGGMSTFGYVGGNPVNGVDPNGLTTVPANDFFNPGINLPPWVGAVARRAGAAYYGVQIGSALGAPFGTWVYDITHPGRRVSPSELPNISISELATKDLLRPWQLSEQCGDDDNVVPFPKSPPVSTPPPPWKDDQDSERCKAVKNECIAKCSEFSLPNPNGRFGDMAPFHRCIRNCMEDQGCFNY